MINKTKLASIIFLLITWNHLELINDLVKIHSTIPKIVAKIAHIKVLFTTDKSMEKINYSFVMLIFNILRG
jgi:hypothetical protein